MIYIFKGVNAICKAPCTACEACCKGCGACGEAFKNACGSCCTAWRDFWEPIQNNPLGTYVLGTFVTMALAVAGAGWGVAQLGECDDEDLKQKLLIFCAADIGLALLHAGMGYYMQRQIVAGIGKDYQQMTAKEIQREAGRILLYDVPVCLYCFVANAAFALNCWGLTLDTCGDAAPQWGAAFVMIAWGVCAGAYLLCWYCCQCCQGTASTLNKPGKGGAGPVVGTPAVTV